MGAIDPADDHAADRVAVIGLVNRFYAPRQAKPRTRDQVPHGYGVQEQCLPFTAAAALGLLIQSPFAWGYCERGAVPTHAHPFRSPIEGGDQKRFFYVIDDADFAFTGNRFSVPAEISRYIGDAPLPGLSFFDRSDQQDHVKLHLPYLWRNDTDRSLLFCAALNRPRADGLSVVAGLVETAIYANPVNLVLRLPPGGGAVHVAAGETIAQAIPVASEARRPELQLLEPHRRQSREAMKAMKDWRLAHAIDRSAYKKLVKSPHGRLIED